MHLDLACADATARVDLEGGRLASLCVQGLELLVTEGTKPSRFGSFPMTPWCGRLAQGRLLFEGEVHELPPTSPPHANHGRAYLQTWQRMDDQTIRTELAPPWPFGGEVTQRFDLEPGALSVTLGVRAGTSPMPAMVGWHPWFRRTLDRGAAAELEFEAESSYATDAAGIPTGETGPPPEAPWDHCFTGLLAGPRITWPGALSLTLESNLDHWVVFTEPEHALCVEPQSGPPNEVNTDPFLLRPGERLVGRMTLRWTGV